MQISEMEYYLKYNAKKRVNKRRRAAVYIIAYGEGSRQYYKTDVEIMPQEWNDKRKEVKASAPNSELKNKHLRELLNTLETAQLNNFVGGAFDAIKSGDNCLFSLIDDVTRNKKKSTAYGYENLKYHLNNYMKGVDLKDINFDFLCKFETYLRSKHLKQNSIFAILKNLRAVFNQAINLGAVKLDKYPFRAYHLKQEQTERAYLTSEEIKRLEDLNGLKDSEEFTKDAFLFAVYTGLRYSDVIRVNNDNISIMQRTTYLNIKMQKTNILINLPISETFNGKALKILDKYKTTNGNYFDRYTLPSVNKRLKDLAKKADINKIVSFHTARHTTATYMLNAGVPIEIVQKYLGHKNISTTMIYAKMLNTTMTRVFKNINWG